MQRADASARAVAAFIDVLIVLGLDRLPDIIGVLAAAGYLLVRDGLFAGQSAGKKLAGISVARTGGGAISFRESLIRNMVPAAAYLLFLVPYAGWALGPLVIAGEALVAIGDERGRRAGDLMADTWTVRAAPADADPGASGPIDPMI